MCARRGWSEGGGRMAEVRDPPRARPPRLTHIPQKALFTFPHGAWLACLSRAVPSPRLSRRKSKSFFFFSGFITTCCLVRGKATSEREEEGRTDDGSIHRASIRSHPCVCSYPTALNLCLSFTLSSPHPPPPGLSRLRFPRHIVRSHLLPKNRRPAHTRTQQHGWYNVDQQQTKKTKQKNF